MGAFPSMSDSHRLLRRLREVMAGATLTPQEKLNQIVTFIAHDMRGDACAVYIQRGGSELELFAAYGFNEDAIHRTFIRAGEGVVGDVVENGRPLVLSDIRSHQRFYLDPKLGEDKLSSFLGTPLARGGRVIGALVVQNKDNRLFSHEEVETLQTVSMVLAEMIVAGDLVKSGELRLSNSEGDMPSVQLRGVVLNGGVAKGRAVLHQPCVPIKRLISENSAKELHRIHDAIEKMKLSLKAMFSESDLAQDEESREVLETYQLFAQDRGWLNRIHKAIESGLTAEAAIQKTLTSLRFRISQTQDTYFRDRLWDFEDLTNRLLKVLVGDDPQDMSFQEEGIIVVARSMGPAELLDYEKVGIKGLILEEGLHTAHVSIIARALHLPVISRIPDILTKVEHGDRILLDGTRGTLVLQPNEEQIEQFETLIKKREANKVKRAFLKELPSISKDGVCISLTLNAGSPLDLRVLQGSTLEGVGLYRSEIPFMTETRFPDVKAQERIYRDVFDRAEGKSVTFRTLDIGGDKLLPYMRKPEDENPILGWRAIRIGLDRPMLLRHQIRALLKASQGKPFSLMFPMIASVEEFWSAKNLFEKECARARDSFDLSSQIGVGAMVEVPSFAWEIEKALPDLDFISIGSNDLFQFFYAADRTNIHLVDRYDCLSVSFLTFLKRLIILADRHKTKVSLCGEMGGCPLEASVLLGLGLRSLSLSPHRMDCIKYMIKSLNISQMAYFIDDLLLKQTGNIRQLFQAYAADHKILLEEY